MTQVWRLCAARFSATAFSGEGARLFSGRWHHAGTPIVYCATSRALAALELLVHVDANLAPTDLRLIGARVPDDGITSLDVDTLPLNWRSVPALDATRDVGTSWAETEASLALLVPSAIVSGESNVLINPQHPRFAEVEVDDASSFSFDPRLVPPV